MPHHSGTNQSEVRNPGLWSAAFEELHFERTVTSRQLHHGSYEDRRAMKPALEPTDLRPAAEAVRSRLATENERTMLVCLGDLAMTISPGLSKRDLLCAREVADDLGAWSISRAEPGPNTARRTGPPPFVIVGAARNRPRARAPGHVGGLIGWIE